MILPRSNESALGSKKLIRFSVQDIVTNRPGGRYYVIDKDGHRLVILFTVTAADQCPDWRLPDAHATSLRLLFALWTLPIVALNGFIVLRWSWVARKAVETERQPSTIPVAHVGRDVPSGVCDVAATIGVAYRRMHSVMCAFRAASLTRDRAGPQKRRATLWRGA